MKAAWLALWIGTLAAAFGLARLTGPGRGAFDIPADLQSIDSFRAALEDRDTLTRSYRLSAFFQGLSAEDVPAVLEILKLRPSGVSQQEVRLLMLAWSRFDAPGAFAWAHDWPTGWRMVLMSEAIYAWGFRDGPAALRVVEAVQDPLLQVRLLPALEEGWLRSNDADARRSAAEYIAGLEEPRRRGRLTFVLAGEVMRDGADSVIRWANGVPEDAPNDFKQGAFYHAASVVAHDDPQRAAKWFELHRTQPYSAGSLTTIAERWARLHDPRGLFDWLRSLPPAVGDRADERSAAIGDGFRTWLKGDPVEAEAWLGSAMPDPELDRAVAELASYLSGSSPGMALDWAARIEDEKLRRSRLVRVSRAGWKSDPEAVTAWLDKNEGLPEKLRRQILRGRRTEAAAGPARSEDR
jgi:hypothetical protein